MILSVLALVLAVFPLCLALDNLRLYRTPAAASGTPCVSVLIPARNEERNIAEAIACVLANLAVTIELIVLDDSSSDATPSILAAITDPRLTVMTAPPLPPGWCGKQHACAMLAARATHDLMVFVDADVRIGPTALCRMAGAMEREPIGLASGFPRQITIGWSEKLLLPLIHMLLLGYLPMRLMRRDPSPSFGAGCGQLMIVRRAAYLASGGHAAIRASMHDGITLPRAFRAAGSMTDLFDATDLATCRMYEDPKSLWEGLLKNATEGMARPAALPVWSLMLAGGHIAPFILMLVSPGILPAAACLCSLALRVVLALRFRQSLGSAVLQPFGVAALLIVQWVALLRAMAGRKAVWRGRHYTVQGSLVIAAWLLVFASASAATMTVTVGNVRNDHGHVLVAVCTRAEFLQPHCKYQASTPALRGVVKVSIQALPPGRYAVQAFHDENDNRVLDRNFLGMPLEGLGFSRDAPMHFGPPGFEAAIVVVGATDLDVGFSLRY